MARYTGPVWKKARRLSFSVLETGEELKKRTYAPGQHGPTKRIKLSGYGTQLREKQRIRICLLYTSDAADEGLGLGVGGGRVLK